VESDWKRKTMAGKFLEGIIDVIIPGLVGTGGFGNPLEAPWGDQPPASISDADGTRGDEGPDLPTGIVNRPPRWWGNFPYPPGGNIVTPVQTNPADPAGDGFEPIRPPQSRAPPQQSSETYQQGADRLDRERAGSRNNQRNQLRERLLREARAKEQQDDFLRNRRLHEQEWRESKENNDIPMRPPRGVLLPFDDDYDLDEDPNETDEERDARRRRSDIIRRGQQAGITLAGGVTAGAIYNTWRKVGIEEQWYHSGAAISTTAFNTIIRWPV
jgi:hypothetical protein